MQTDYLTIPLSRGFVAIVDADLGEWLGQWKWRATSGQRGYVAAFADVRIGGRRHMVSMHRLVAGARNGEVVDHINGDPLDNRRCNLRRCTRGQNSKNQGARGGRQFKGVYPKNGRFMVRIMCDRKTVAVGSFETELEAAVAYDIAAKELHGEFARLNFDPSRDWLFPFDFSKRPKGKRPRCRSARA